MNQALAILAHALRMLTHEPAMTLRVIAPALLIIVGTVSVALATMQDTLVAFQTAPESFALPEGAPVLLMFLLLIAGLVGTSLLAILWHRHVLLNGTGIDSDLRAGTAVILGYLWRALVLGAVQFLIAIPIIIAMTIIGTAVASIGGTALFPLITVAASLLFIWIALRISVVLPAAALGTSMRIGESWEATAPAANTLWSVALLFSLINLGVGLLANIIMPDNLTLAIIVQTLVYILEALVFISVLTTLYGHLIEGRSLG